MDEPKPAPLTDEQVAHAQQIMHRDPWTPEKKRFAWIVGLLSALIVVIVVGIIVFVNISAQQAHDQRVADCSEKYSPTETAYFLCIDG